MANDISAAARPLYDELVRSQMTRPEKSVSGAVSRCRHIATWYALHRPGQPVNAVDKDDYVAARMRDGKTLAVARAEWDAASYHLRAGQPAYDTKALRQERTAHPSLPDTFTPKRDRAPTAAMVLGSAPIAKRTTMEILTEGFVAIIRDLPDVTEEQKGQITRFLLQMQTKPVGDTPAFSEEEATEAITFLEALPVTATAHRETIAFAVERVAAIAGKPHVIYVTDATARKSAPVADLYATRCERLVGVMHEVKANLRFARPERLQAIDRIVTMLRNPEHNRGVLADELTELDASLYSISASHRTAIVHMVDSINPNSGIARDLTPNDRYSAIRGGKNEWPACIPLPATMLEAFQHIDGRGHWISHVYACAWSGIGPNGTLYDHMREETLEAMACIWDLREQEEQARSGRIMGGLILEGQLSAMFAERLASGRWGFPELHRVLWLLRYSICQQKVTEFHNLCNFGGRYPDWSGLRPDGGDGIALKDWIVYADKSIPKANAAAYRAALAPDARAHYDRCQEQYAQRQLSVLDLLS